MQNIDVSQLTQQFPLLQSLIALEPVSWFNPKATTLVEGLPMWDWMAAMWRMPPPAWPASPLSVRSLPETRASKVLSNPTSPPSRRCCAP